MSDQAGTGALDAAIEAALKLVWDDELAVSKADAVALVRAAAPLIPVTPEQRADIERDTLLRAAAAAQEMGEFTGWAEILKVADWLRARAASVGTEEGR